MKRIVSVQDISCFGKCSLTVALPIISVMGIETVVIPTAVLSTHTGSGFSGYTFHELTDDIPKISDHWKTLDLKFDALYTGYLGSAEQVQIVSDLFDRFGSADNFIVVDPVLGDGGSLYAGITDELVTKMRSLCCKADYIMPNMTEVSFLLGIPYTDNYDQCYVEDVLKKLAELGCPTPLLTGVHFDNDFQGAAAYDSINNKYYYSFGKSIDHTVHGTGDIFASVFTGAVTLGKSIQEALDISVKFTLDCIEATLPYFEETWYGTCFESCLGNLIDYIK